LSELHLRWIDGRWVDGRFTEDVRPRGSARGVFETLRCRDGSPELVEAHLRRLEQGARALALPWPPLADLRAALADLARARPRGTWRLRIVYALDELGPVACADARPHAEPSGAIELWTAPPGSFPEKNTEIKTIAREPYERWRERARAVGAWDALLCDARGDVLEATVANVFLALDGELVTPPLATGVLPGIVRGVLLDDLERRLPPAVRGVVERTIEPEDLARASEVLLTSSLVGVLGADRILGTAAAAHLPGRRGPVAEALGRRLGEIVGADRRTTP